MLHYLRRISGNLWTKAQTASLIALFSLIACSGEISDEYQTPPPLQPGSGSGGIGQDTTPLGGSGTSATAGKPPGAGGIAGAMAPVTCTATSCPANQVCEAGQCKPGAQSGCGAGLTACGAVCANVTSDPAHCGACSKACAAGQSCTAGVCACPAGKVACGDSCVDVSTDNANCGTCGNACTGSRTCVAGACACPAGQTLCGDACVDVRTSATNCGACGTACSNGQTCTAGACACAAGQQLCGTVCTDVQTSAANCGMCGKACTLGQTCMAGQCAGSVGGTAGEDGCSGLAQGLTISKLAIYQTVEIPIMNAGTEVAAAQRVTDVVAGRAAVLRVFVSVASGWTARQLSARLLLESATGVETIFAKAQIAGNTVQDNLASSFQIVIPAGKLAADSKYAVEVVECGGTGSGGAQTPRFPATAGIALGARTTGPVKVRFVPLQVNGMLPDTTETGLAAYKAILLAMYPVSDVQLSVDEPLTIASATNWSGNLDAVRSRRQMDMPTPDVYYYGLLKPAASLREFCNGGCTTGIGYVPGGSGNNQAAQRAALGIGFADAASAETFAHELGHNHGRNHAPCGGVSGADPNFPDAMGRTGVWGFDNRTMRLMAPDRTDLMGYCQNKWLSAYNYDAMLNRVATVNGAMNQITLDDGPRDAWNILLVEDGVPRWGIPLPTPVAPAGEPESADVLDVSGRKLASVTVYRTEISDIDAASIEVPSAQPGWHSIRVAGAAPYPFGAPVVVPTP